MKPRLVGKKFQLGIKFALFIQTKDNLSQKWSVAAELCDW
jgi:hypothetical protein